MNRNQGRGNNRGNRNNNNQNQQEELYCPPVNQNDNVALVTMKKGSMIEREEDIWINDTAATSYITNNLDGMTDLVKIDGSIRVGDGHDVKVEYRGTFNGVLEQDNKK